VESLRTGNDPVVAAYATRRTVCKEVSYAAVHRPLDFEKRFPSAIEAAMSGH